jgi:hypothetical protein
MENFLRLKKIFIKMSGFLEREDGTRVFCEWLETITISPILFGSAFASMTALY